MGLLTKLGAGRHQKAHQDLDANTTGTGDKIFADFLDTVDDNDDLQIQAQRGKLLHLMKERYKDCKEKERLMI